MMEFNNIDPVALAALGLAVIGIVELIKRLFDRDFRAAVIIGGSAVVGAVFAPYAGDISWFSGMLVGLQASGLVTTISYFGNK